MVTRWKVARAARFVALGLLLYLGAHGMGWAQVKFGMLANGTPVMSYQSPIGQVINQAAGQSWAQNAGGAIATETEHVVYNAAVGAKNTVGADIQVARAVTAAEMGSSAIRGLRFGLAGAILSVGLDQALKYAQLEWDDVRKQMVYNPAPVADEAAGYGHYTNSCAHSMNEDDGSLGGAVAACIAQLNTLGNGTWTAAGTQRSPSNPGTIQFQIFAQLNGGSIYQVGSADSVSPTGAPPSACPNGVTFDNTEQCRQDIGDGDAAPKLTPGLQANPNVGPAIAPKLAGGPGVQSGAQPQLSGQSQVQSQPNTTTTTTPAGNVTTTSQTTVNQTFNNSTSSSSNVTYNITNTSTTTNADGSTTTTTDTPNKDPDTTPPVADSELPEQPKLYTRQFPNGFQGVWEQHKQQCTANGPGALLSVFAIQVNDAAMSPWILPLNFGGPYNFGTFDISLQGWIVTFCRAVVIFGAIVYARKLIFGG